MSKNSASASAVFFLDFASIPAAEIPGISAAGINAKSRRTTALADAEFLLEGASKDHKYKLPLLNAGVTPALISHVCSKLINIYPVIVPLGIGAKPYFNHLVCLLYTSPSPRDRQKSRMPSSA